jgi:hypothetical protein
MEKRCRKLDDAASLTLAGLGRAVSPEDLPNSTGHRVPADDRVELTRGD